MQQPPILQLQFEQSNQISAWVTVVKNVKIPHENALPHVPKWIVERYEPYLLSGVKALMMIQGDKPYSDPKLGAIEYNRFRNGVNIARVAAMRRNVWGGQAWAYPQQFRAGSQHGWAVSIGNTRRF